MDWLNQHLRLTVTILPVVFLTLVPGEQVSAQQGRPVPSMPSESGRPSTPGSGPLSTPGLGSGLPSTPGTGTAGSDTVPSPGSQSPNPFRTPEMPPLSPESLQPTPVMPTPVTPTPGERKPERDPTRSLDRPERPAGAAALPSRSPIEQIFGGDPLQSKLSRDPRQFGYDLFREPVSTFAPVDRRACGAGVQPGARGCDASLSLGDGR
jgi:hypothetical protein